jgi:hypothetical protein
MLAHQRERDAVIHRLDEVADPDRDVPALVTVKPKNGALPPHEVRDDLLEIDKV